MARITAALCGVLCLVSASAAQAGSLRIAWNANPESSVIGYRVRFGTASKTYSGTLDVGNRTSYEIAGLTEGELYYVAVQAYTAGGVTSPLSAEVAGYATSPLITSAINANILLGLGEGPQTGAGGWFSIHAGAENTFSRSAWGRVPWPTYNSLGYGIRLASGDVDGDGLDEVVAGLGPGSNGWVAVLDDATHGYGLLSWIQVPWAPYATSNGEVFPAVGDLDGDSRKEIVLGLGGGGQGWFLILDDYDTGFKHLAWKQVDWPAYNASGEGATHPAVGDLDGNGKAEIVVGLGKGSSGWMQVLNNSTSNFSSRGWVQVAWPTYNAANGTVFPAVGDTDGDGRGEIVAGLGKGADGWFVLLEDAVAKHAQIKWERIAWPNYNAHSGETHPAVGNVDTDAAAEIVFGFAAFPGAGGWFEVRDDASKGYASKGWKSIGWDLVTASGSSLFPAVSKR
jgi:hypothetical protein